jgi:hypothetical protein
LVFRVPLTSDGALPPLALNSTHKSNANTPAHSAHVFGNIPSVSPAAMDAAAEAEVSRILNTWVGTSVDAVTWFSALGVIRRWNSDSYNGSTKHACALAPEVAVEQLMQPHVVQPYRNLPDSGSIDAGAHRNMYLGVAVCGLRHLSTIDGNKKKEISLPVYLLRESLKLDSAALQAIQMVYDTVSSFQSLAARLATATNVLPTIAADSTAEHVGFTREEAGLLLRATRHLWAEVLWIACAEELALMQPCLYHTHATASQSPRDNVYHSHANTMTAISLQNEAVQRKIQSYFRLEQRLISLGLCGRIVRAQGGGAAANTMDASLLQRYRNLPPVWDLKPLLDGNRLMGTIGLKRGPLVGRVMDAQLRWQLNHPPLHSDDRAATAVAAGRSEEEIAQNEVEACATYLKQYLDSLSQ